MAAIFFLFAFFECSAIFTIRLQKFWESFKSTFTIVVNDFVITFHEQFDGREALDFDIFQFVGSRVHFGDNNIVFVGEFLSQFVPDGDELFAMSWKMNEKCLENAQKSFEVRLKQK